MTKKEEREQIVDKIVDVAKNINRSYWEIPLCLFLIIDT